LIGHDLTIYVVWSSTAYGGRRLVVAISRDQGKSFSNQIVAGSAARTPALAEGRQGQIDLAYGDDTNNDTLSDRIMLMVSLDGGASFTTPMNVSLTPGPAFSPNLGVDQSDRLYLEWHDGSPAKPGILVGTSLTSGNVFNAP